MELPKKDKNGNSYLSYSQISLFKNDPDQYYKSYILNEPFEGNEHTDFGSKVGQALELNNFSNFNSREQITLNKVERLDKFEQPIFLRYDSFYIVGFIDSCSEDYKHIIDYKTGGKNKHTQYESKHYLQIPIYALGIRQEHQINVEKAEVHFIERSGNIYKGEDFKVSEKDPIIIDIDVSYERLVEVYYSVLNTAKEINKFYLRYAE